MGKKDWRSREEREAWDRHIEEAVRNLRELAGGRAEREARERESGRDLPRADEAREAL